MKAKSKLELFKELTSKQAKRTDDCIRAPKEDDDGYDPYSDRKPEREQLFDQKPWD